MLSYNLLLIVYVHIILILCVIASDGLWDVMSNEDVSKFVYKKYLALSGPTSKTANKKYHKHFVYIAKQLCEEASILGSKDNITVQIIDLSLPTQ